MRQLFLANRSHRFVPSAEVRFPGGGVSRERRLRPVDRQSRPAVAVAEVKPERQAARRGLAAPSPRGRPRASRPGTRRPFRGDGRVARGPRADSRPPRHRRRRPAARPRRGARRRRGRRGPGAFGASRLWRLPPERAERVIPSDAGRHKIPALASQDPPSGWVLRRSVSPGRGQSAARPARLEAG